MKFETVDPPRTFKVGRNNIEIKDCAHIRLEPDEQVTFFTESGAEYDVTRKSWGFYATPSLNARLKRFGLRGVMVKGKDGKFFVFLVENGKEEDMNRYLEIEGLSIVYWLDDDLVLSKLVGKSE